MNAPTEAPVLLDRARRWKGIERFFSILSAVSIVGIGGLIGHAALTETGKPASRPPQKMSIYAAGETEGPRKAGAMKVTATPSEGFMILVDSEPQGAEAFLDGESIGVTPASVNPACKPGSGFVVEVRQQGFRSVSEEITCSQNKFLMIETKLRKK